MAYRQLLPVWQILEEDRHLLEWHVVDDFCSFILLIPLFLLLFGTGC